MKVLHVVPTYWPAARYGGPIYSVHGLCMALAAQGIEVSVFTTSVDGKENSQVDHGRCTSVDGVNVFYFESTILRRIYYSRSLGRALDSRIREFDLVHLHSIFLYPTNKAARIAARDGVPYLLSPRGMLEKSLVRNKSAAIKKAWLSLIERKTIETASLLHLTSPREKRELQRFDYTFPPVAVIPNGVDLAAYQTQNQDRSKDVFQILFLGRLNAKKQIDRIIEALPLLDFNARLIIAGNDEAGYKTFLERRILQLNIQALDHIEICFAGPVLGDEKTRCLSRSDVMVLPSLSENFGNTVIEAMAAGCPVVVTAEVGASDIVARSGAGLLTDGSARDIARKLSYIRLNPDQARQMSTSGIREVNQNYQWPKIASAMIKAYNSVLEHHGRARGHAG